MTNLIQKGRRLPMMFCERTAHNGRPAPLARPAGRIRTAGLLSLLVGTAGAIPCASHGQSPNDATVTLEYIAHASFRVHSPGGSTVVIDPYASRVWLGYDFPTPVSASAVVITHPHYDHDGGRYRDLEVPWGAGMRIIDGPGTHEVGDIVVYGIEGKHADPYGKEFGQINTIFVVETAGLRIAHVGDNGPLTSANVREMGRVDVLMMPIDGVFHILAEDEVEAMISDVSPRITVPMHYRIPALETDPESPSDLGPIDPWLAGRSGVHRLDGHTFDLSRHELGEAPQIVVFRHSPDVPVPASAGESNP